jgi:hypothetical protein
LRLLDPLSPTPKVAPVDGRARSAPRQVANQIGPPRPSAPLASEPSPPPLPSPAGCPNRRARPGLRYRDHKHGTPHDGCQLEHLPPQVLHLFEPKPGPADPPSREWRLASGLNAEPIPRGAGRWVRIILKSNFWPCAHSHPSSPQPTSQRVSILLVAGISGRRCVSLAGSRYRAAITP